MAHAHAYSRLFLEKAVIAMSENEWERKVEVIPSLRFRVVYTEPTARGVIWETCVLRGAQWRLHTPLNCLNNVIGSRVCSSSMAMVPCGIINLPQLRSRTATTARCLCFHRWEWLAVRRSSRATGRCWDRCSFVPEDRIIWWDLRLSWGETKKSLMCRGIYSNMPMVAMGYEQVELWSRQRTLN